MLKLSNHERLPVQVHKRSRSIFILLQKWNIKDWKAKFWFGGRQIPYKFYLIYKKRLTAFVLTALWRAVKKNASTESRVAYRLKEEQKRSWCFERTLLIKNFKYGSSFSLFVWKNSEAQRSQISQFFVMIITRHACSILGWFCKVIKK